MDEATPSKQFSLPWGIVAECGLVALAIGLSFLGLYDQRQPLRAFGSSQLLAGVGWGVCVSLPLLMYLLAFHFAPARWFGGLRKFCFDQLRSLFAGASLLMLGLLSIAAGLGEELLFRWSFQGGLTSLLEPGHGRLTASLVGLLAASLVFGLCHAITRLYFLLTFLGGLVLGSAMIYFQNWLVPAVAHAIYDFVALVYIVRILKDPNSAA